MRHLRPDSFYFAASMARTCRGGYEGSVFSLLILTENHALQARASVTIWARTGFSSVFLFLVDAIMDVAQMSVL
jgi:hypothetical protein